MRQPVRGDFDQWSGGAGGWGCVGIRGEIEDEGKGGGFGFEEARERVRWMGYYLLLRRLLISSDFCGDGKQVMAESGWGEAEGWD